MRHLQRIVYILFAFNAKGKMGPGPIHCIQAMSHLQALAQFE